MSFHYFARHLLIIQSDARKRLQVLGDIFNNAPASIKAKRLYGRRGIVEGKKKKKAKRGARVAGGATSPVVIAECQPSEPAGKQHLCRTRRIRSVALHDDDARDRLVCF